jgi:GMP synthase (glutamine-hydrolysing)
MITIIDFGSQYTQLIARRVRELGVYCEVIPWQVATTMGHEQNCRGYILSGGPDSVTKMDYHPVPRLVLEGKVPVLGICYGMQCLSASLGGQVSSTERGEYGLARMELVDKSPLFEDWPTTNEVWMSHRDHVHELPAGFRIIARTENASIVAMSDNDNRIFGVLFHPEVTHTSLGKVLLSNFVCNVCSCQRDWNPVNIIAESLSAIRNQVDHDEQALCAVSGGLDSSVAAVIARRVLGDRLLCIFIDHGLLRENEAESVVSMLPAIVKSPIVKVDASERFLSALRGVTDPEQKRRIIGELFIRIFEDEAATRNIHFLIQGTLYSDVIESAPVIGAVTPTLTARIKSHHNVGGIPKDIKLKLVEPLRKLFKDEVRQIGRELGLPDQILLRHPFPGPGLAIRCIGQVTPQRLETLRKADSILTQELHAKGLDRETALAFTVLLPIRSVGVMGDTRSYGQVIALRIVTSEDLMTADWKRLPYAVLDQVSARIVNEVPDVNRVVFDITSKPPATIDWE